MFTHKRLTVGIWLLAVSFTLMIGCNNSNPENPNITDSEHPYVVSTVPGNISIGVATEVHITATFTEAMDSATIASPKTNMALSNAEGEPVSSTVTLSANGLVATLIPTTRLNPSSRYLVQITMDVKDRDNNPMKDTYTWSFITIDDLAPWVVSTIPDSFATGVPLDATLTVGFSEAMDEPSINDTTWTLTYNGGLSNVSGGIITRAEGGFKGFYQPPANLLPSTLYTSTLTVGVKDLFGNPLVSAYVWTFTTGN